MLSIIQAFSFMGICLSAWSLPCEYFAALMFFVMVYSGAYYYEARIK